MKNMSKTNKHIQHVRRRLSNDWNGITCHKMTFRRLGDRRDQLISEIKSLADDLGISVTHKKSEVGDVIRFTFYRI